MAQKNVIETKIDGDGQPNGETVSFRVMLDNLKGFDPLTVDFDADSTIKEMTSSMEQRFKLGQSLRLQTAFQFESVPPTFEVKVADVDHIDFDTNTFSISKNTRFVEYWNDFLDAATMVEEQKNTEQTEGEVQYDGQLKAQLDGTMLRIGDAQIEFQRTVKSYPVLSYALYIFSDTLCAIGLSSSAYPTMTRRILYLHHWGNFHVESLD